MVYEHLKKQLGLDKYFRSICTMHHGENQKTVEYGDDIEATFKCIWYSYSVNRFTIVCLKSIIKDTPYNYCV